MALSCQYDLLILTLIFLHLSQFFSFFPLNPSTYKITPLIGQPFWKGQFYDLTPGIQNFRIPTPLQTLRGAGAGAGLHPM